MPRLERAVTVDRPIAFEESAPALARADAFRRLAERHLEESYRLARAILHDSAEAEDATHDAFVTAWRKWSTLRDASRFEHWFDRILVNTCRNRLRDRTRVARGLWDDEMTREGDGTGRLGEREAIESALAALSPDQRIVVALRFYRDLSIHEIAHRVGARPGTVKSRLHYALRKLHRQLDAADAREALR
jgi:RNA polymerase sigma-70 factor (ECF subfamily)